MRYPPRSLVLPGGENELRHPVPSTPPFYLTCSSPENWTIRRSPFSPFPTAWKAGKYPTIKSVIIDHCNIPSRFVRGSYPCGLLGIVRGKCDNQPVGRRMTMLARFHTNILSFRSIYTNIALIGGCTACPSGLNPSPHPVLGKRLVNIVVTLECGF